jgi:hypothetical protein
MKKIQLHKYKPPEMEKGDWTCKNLDDQLQT